MRWDFYCNDGSPMGIVPQDIYGDRGVGGAELALLSLTETLAKLGHEVRIYNNPRKPADSNGVEFRTHGQFRKPHNADVFVLFRSPNPALQQSKAGVKLFWSCDQYTTGDYRKEIFPRVDKIITISPFHTEFFRKYWDAPVDKTHHIDLGVRLEDYEKLSGIKKKPGKAIYCSVPGRGLGDLVEIWPKIVSQMEDARLIITSDFSLWGSPSPRNRQWRLKFARVENVSFKGKVPRAELVRHQMEAMVHIFPCSYDELFCISAAECQAAGAVPVTTSQGALSTTNRWGIQIEGDPSTNPWRHKCVKWTLEGLKGGLEEERQAGIEGAKREFDWNMIAQQWVDLVEKGTFPLSEERGENSP